MTRNGTPNMNGSPMPAPENFALVDSHFSRILEETEGLANASFVEAHRQLENRPDLTWERIGGAFAMFDGVDSPVTQTFGLGLFDPLEDRLLDQIEAFFFDRGSAVYHEISPLVEPSHLGILSRRGYQPIEYTTILYRRAAFDSPEPNAESEDLTVQRVERDDMDRWAKVAMEGWSSEMPPSEPMAAIFRACAHRSPETTFWAWRAGTPIATGALFLNTPVGLLAGASTVPSARRLGAQRKLLEARLAFAAERGCEWALMGALPGSASQRNAQRQGFQIAYTRTKWQRLRP